MTCAYGGLDPSASAGKPSGAALIDRQGRLIQAVHAKTDADIIGFFSQQKIHALAIDAPKGLPMGMGLCCLQDHPVCDCELTSLGQCERELQRRGVSLYPVTKNAFAKGWIRRGLLLYLRFQSIGISCEEVYPAGCKRRLFPKEIWSKPKSGVKARTQLQTLLRRRIKGIPTLKNGLLSDHKLDAIIAAYCVYLYHEKKRGERLGDPSEGQIILP